MLQLWGSLPPGLCFICQQGNTFPCTQSHLQMVCGMQGVLIATHHFLCSLLSTFLVSSTRGWESHPEHSLGATCTLLLGLDIQPPEQPPFLFQYPGRIAAPPGCGPPSVYLACDMACQWDSSADYDNRQHEIKGQQYSVCQANSPGPTRMESCAV